MVMMIIACSPSALGMAQNCLLLLAGGLPKGSLPTSMEGEPSTDVVFGGFSDKVPPFALKKKRKQHCLPKMADASCQHGG